ncbi:MAG: signal peptidase I [Bacteroidota bacterium]
MEQQIAQALAQSQTLETSREKFIGYSKTLLLAVGVALTLKMFVVEAYRIPTSSMEQSLLVGDFLLVNKLSYGLSSPRYIPFTSKAIPAFSIPMFTSVKRSDVIVFEYPGDREQFGEGEPVYFVKRCVGLPGDWVEIRSGEVYVNDRRMETPPNALLASDHYKARRVPSKGQSIDLDPSSVEEWKPIVLREGHEVSTDERGAIFVDGRPVKTYRIEQDYYFVMGDNRENSLDSRFWGFVPEKNIVGEAFLVYWSWDPKLPIKGFVEKFKSIRWERIGKIVD